MTDPRSAVICRTTGWNDEDDDDAHYVALILAALDIHAAAELARQREGCVPVRIAVRMFVDGKYEASADPHSNWRVSSGALSIVTAYIKPPVAQEIDGEVETP